MTPVVLLRIVAAVLFCVATFVKNSDRFNLIAAGLCLVTVSFLVPDL